MEIRIQIYVRHFVNAFTNTNKKNASLLTDETLHV